MNKKKTNYVISILNVVAIVSVYILYFLKDYLLTSIIPIDSGGKSIYNNFLIEFFLNNIQMIMILLNSGLGIINIICAFQNKENKKLWFWYLIFGIYEISSIITLSMISNNYDIYKWISIIIYGVIPIILGIVNLALIKKNKPKVIQIISYVVVIIFSILIILDIFTAYWDIVAIIMQLIYIYYQDKNISEEPKRKFINIILYYVLQLILVIVFFFMLVYSLIITKVNEIKWEGALSELYNNVSELQGATNKDVYIPVEKNYKYGFISKSGKEEIPCEYDRVTYFNEVEINDNTYYISLAKKDNKFYILSKSNDSIAINDTLEKYLKNIDTNFAQMFKSMFDESERSAYLQSFEMIFNIFTRNKIELNIQTVENDYEDNEISLTEKNYNYSYNSKNYSMFIEPIEDEDYYTLSEMQKYNVTITKINGEKESSVVYLPTIDEINETISTFTNGYIEFESQDHMQKGWYDSNGNKTVIPNGYSIKDIKDDKVILKEENDDEEDEEYEDDEILNFVIIDMTGRILLQTTALDIYDNMYLVKRDNKKMILLDNNLQEISNEYDRIITNAQMDISTNYSSYY